jgi:hypothetical protein
LFVCSSVCLFVLRILSNCSFERNNVSFAVGWFYLQPSRNCKRKKSRRKTEKLKNQNQNHCASSFPSSLRLFIRSLSLSSTKQKQKQNWLKFCLMIDLLTKGHEWQLANWNDFNVISKTIFKQSKTN